MSFYLSKTSLKRLDGVDERLVEVVKKAIEITKVDFSVVSGYRTAEEQNKLYLEGKSECDGYKNKSKHQEGLAVDVAPYKEGKLLWDMEAHAYEWLEVGRAMLRSARLLGVDLTWGLTFNIGEGYDLPHFEIKE